MDVCSCVFMCVCVRACAPTKTCVIIYESNYTTNQRHPLSKMDSG